MKDAIWVVDDNEAVAESVVLLFQAHNLAARSYTKTKDVIRDLDEGREPSVLVLDIKMPYNGITLLEKIVSDPKWMFPLIVISGADIEIPKSSAGRVWQSLLKPVDPIKLLEAVERLLGKK